MPRPSSQRTVYLDYAAATPLRDEVLQVMAPYWQTDFGNPSTITGLGVRARAAVEDSRGAIARILGAHTDELIFTGGGTESANAALFGMLEAGGPTSHLIISTIEHHAVLEAASRLASRGYPVSTVPVQPDGLIDQAALLAAVRPETRLISVIWANNEVGTIQPLKEIARALGRLNRRRAQAGLDPIRLHTDACQAPGSLAVNVAELGVDALTLNAAKIGGPKGVGLLYLRRHTPFVPQLVGGGQEAGRRSGTENVPGIVGFATALALAQADVAREAPRLTNLRDRLLGKLQVALPDLQAHGSLTERLPNHLSLAIPGIEAEVLVLYLDQDGVVVGSGAACSNITLEPSHVLLALGVPPELALATIRITLGRATTQRDIDWAASQIIKRVNWLREQLPSRVPLA